MLTWRDVARIAARHGIAPNAPLEEEITRRGLSLAVSEVCDARGDAWYHVVLRGPDGQVVAEGRAPQRGGGRFLNQGAWRIAVLRALVSYLVTSGEVAPEDNAGRISDEAAQSPGIRSKDAC